MGESSERVFQFRLLRKKVSTLMKLKENCCQPFFFLFLKFSLFFQSPTPFPQIPLNCKTNKPENTKSPLIPPPPPPTPQPPPFGAYLRFSSIEKKQRRTSEILKKRFPDPFPS